MTTTVQTISRPHASHARHLMWVPAALLLAAAVMAASGVPLVPRSDAATTTIINATVGKEVHLSISACGTVTGTAPNQTGTITSAGFGPSTDQLLGSCTFTFGSNNNGTTGASLFMESARTSGGNTFCDATLGVTTACAASKRFVDVLPAGVTVASFQTAPTGADGKFGITPQSAPSNCTGWTTASYYGLPSDTNAAGGSTACSTSSTSDGTLIADYHAYSGPSQEAVAYKATILATAAAN